MISFGAGGRTSVRLCRELAPKANHSHQKNHPSPTFNFQPSTAGWTHSNASLAESLRRRPIIRIKRTALRQKLSTFNFQPSTT